MWNVITANKYGFYNLGGILLPLLFEGCTGAGPVDDCCCFSRVSQSAKFKVEYKKSMYGTGTAITRGTDQGQRCSIDLLVNAFHF